MTKDKLEKKLSELMQLRYFILTGYARNGLYLLIKALELDDQAEVITPAYTCSIIPTTIREAGVVPILVDSEDRGLNIDPSKIEKAITGNTRAIYVIHTYGTAARIEEICAIAKRYNLILIEDLAHSLFSRYKGRQLGTFGDFAVLSFTKKIINFEGGAIGTNNKLLYERMLSLQQNYKRYRLFSFDDYINNISRLVGSIWESRFSFIALLLLKMLDISDRIFFKGQYGLGVDHRKFFMHDLAKRVTLNQLDALNSNNIDKNKNGYYLIFRNKFSNRMIFPELNQGSNDPLPLYYVAAAKRNIPFTFFSFRTWINYNKPGSFPRADYLYSNVRIFARLFGFFKGLG